LDLISGCTPALKTLELTLWGGDPFLAWPAWKELEQKIAALAQQHGFTTKYRVVANAIPKDIGKKELAGIGRLVLNDPSFTAAPIPVVYLSDFRRVADKHTRFGDGSAIRFIRNQPAANLCRNLNGLCQSVPEFTDEEYDIIRRLVLEGVDVRNLPRPKDTACQAVDPQSYIIDNAGSVYKCWNDVGKPECDCAAVLDDPMSPQLFQWMAWNPFRQQHCRMCNILPWCQGGCIAKPANEDCGNWRYALRELLKLVIMSKEKRGE
jgi:radical SAM protein with 4Fe4S-binding SPASM domain